MYRMTRSPGVVRRKRSVERRAEVIAAATSLYAERGYPNVSMADVAGAVGVTSSALYRHFRNREDLFAATVARAAERSLALVSSAQRSGATAEETVAALVDAAVTMSLDERATTIVLLRESVYLPPAANGSGRSGGRRLAEAWSSALRRMRPELSGKEARLLAVAAGGVLLGTIGHPGTLGRRVTPALLRRLALAVLHAERPAALAHTAAGAARDSAPGGPRARPGPPGTITLDQDQRGFDVPRREAVLAAAAALFRRSGYRGVGMDEIGAAARTSGPAVYRYFRNKEDLLSTAFRRTGDRIASRAARAVELSSTPDEALEALVASYVDVALEIEDLLVVYLREARSLSASAREEFSRIQNEFIATWGQVLQRHHPGLAGADARTASLAVIGVVNAAVSYELTIDAGVRRAWMTAAALAAARAT